MIEKFDDKVFEQEIADLWKDVQAKNTPDAPKEAIKNVMGEKLYPTGNEGMTSAPTAQTPVTDPTSPLPRYAASLSPEAKLKVDQLIDHVFHKGLASVVHEVRKSDPLTMDVFHDAITERLYAEFKRRGIIRPTD